MRFARRLPCLAACLALAFPTVAPADESTGPLLSVGWLHQDCLASAEADIEAGTEIQVVVLGEPQTVQTTKVISKAAADGGCQQTRPGRTGTIGDADASYFKVSPWNTDAGDIAIGLIGGTPPAIDGGIARASVDGVPNVVFTQCATGEGLQFDAWAGKPNQGEPLWQGYYGLDYDLEPSCP